MGTWSTHNFTLAPEPCTAANPSKTNMSKYNELVAKLREIFQIDRPELDFGIYRILNARARRDQPTTWRTGWPRKLRHALSA
jgi:hypothetical protein